MASALWAAIALSALIACVRPLESGAGNVTALRGAALFAVLMALVSFGSSWRRLGATFYVVMATAMSLDVGVIYYFGGSLRGEFALLFTFVVVFTAYFFARGVIVAQLALIAVLLAGRALAFGANDLPSAEMVRVWMLVPALIMIAWLVSVLRARVQQREVELRAQSSQDAVSGLLSAIGFGRKLEEELARVSAMGMPASLIVVEVGGGTIDAETDSATRLARAVGRTIGGKLRPDDHAARIGGLRYAVVAPVAEPSAGQQLAATIAGSVRERMEQLGYAGEGLEISIGCASFPQDASLPEDLMAIATRATAPVPAWAGRVREPDHGVQSRALDPHHPAARPA